MDEYEGMRKFGREVDKLAGKMREMRASSEVEKMKRGPDGRQSASRERGMIGIERLRRLARSQNMDNAWTAMLAHELCDIADQIEHDARDAVEIRKDAERALCVELDAPIDEGADPLDVLRRHVGCLSDTIENLRLELGKALKTDTSPAADTQNPSWHDPADAADVTSDAAKVTRDPSADVSMSAYDLLPEEDRDAVAWAREHGGLDAVKRRWECLSYYADPVPRSCMEKRLARLQRQIDESHAALRRRNARIGFLVSELNQANHENHEEFMRRAGDYTALTDEVCKRLAPELRYVEGCSKDVMDAALDALDRRLMPEGYEWPRFESGELVQIGDDVVGRFRADAIKVRSIEFRDGDTYLCEGCKTDRIILVRPGERVNRPAPKALASDGEPLEVGQTVYHIADGKEYTVEKLFKGGAMVTHDGITGGRCRAEYLTHRAPVLAADGKPLREGETAWGINGATYRVTDVRDGEVFARHIGGSFGAEVESAGGSGLYRLRAEQLSHERPDSFEQLEKDANDLIYDIGFHLGDYSPSDFKEEGDSVQDRVRDLVRRAKKLAGVSE